MEIKKKHVLFSVVTIAAVLQLTSCGGGGGGNESPPPNSGNPNTNNPGTGSPDSGIPNNPLNQAQCEAISEYEWNSDKCRLKNNPYVNNLYLIEALPPKDRSDLIDWLSKMEKQISFDHIFPRFEEDLASTPTSSGSIFQSFRALDEHLFRDKIDNKSYINSPDGLILFSDAELSQATHTRSVTHEVSINNLPVEYKEAAIELNSGTLSLSLFGTEIYRFKMIKSLEVSAHFGDNQVYSENEAQDIKLKTSTQDYSVFRGETFLNLTNKSIQPDDNTRSATQSFLSLSDDFSKNQLTLSTQLNLKMAMRIDNSPLFIKGGLSQDHVYLPSNAAAAKFNKDTFSIKTEATVKLGDLLYVTENATQEVLIFDTEIKGKSNETTSTAQNKRNFSLTEIEVQPINTYTIEALTKDSPFDIASELKKRLNAMRNSADILDYELETWNHYPDYSTLSPAILRVATSEEDLVESIRTNNELRQQLLLRATPTYYNISPSLEQLGKTRQWPNDLSHLLSTSFKHADKTLNELTVSWLSESNNTPFYNDLRQALSDVFADLDSFEREYYAESLTDMYVNLAYLALLDNAELISTEDLVAAVKAAGTEFSQAVIRKIVLTGKPKTSIGTSNPWKLDTQAIAALESVPELLTNDNIILIRRHDDIAPAYDAPIVTIDFLDISSNPDDLNQYLNTKLNALNALDDFVKADRPNLSSEFDFNSGAKLVAARAYEEEWNSTTYQDIEKIMSFAYLRSPISGENFCSKPALLERIDCTERFASKKYNKYSTIEGQGYLAEYDTGVKPFVEKSGILAQIDSTLIEIEKLAGPLSFSVRFDFENEVEDGLWLDCSAQQISDNIDQGKVLADAILALVEIEANPSLFSDMYTQQQDANKAFTDHLEKCSN